MFISKKHKPRTFNVHLEKLRAMAPNLTVNVKESYNARRGRPSQLKEIFGAMAPIMALAKVKDTLKETSHIFKKLHETF